MSEITEQTKAEARKAMGLELGVDIPAMTTPGILIPSGGTGGQVLAKSSNADHALQWATPSSSGGPETDPVASAALATHAALGASAHGGIVANNDARLSDARAPLTHTHSADDLTDGTTNKAFLAAERTKLTGIAAAATANATDAQLRDRSTHTGTQAANTITGLAAVATSGAKADVGLGSVDNTADASKPVSTAQAAAIDAGSASYKTILSVTGSHTAAKAAGTYAMGQGDPLAVSGTGTLYPIGLIHIVAADYPTVNGKAPKLRIRAQVECNDVAPTGNFTFGLYPVTRPATSGAAGLCIYTLGTVVSGSNGATVTTPAADSSNLLVGSDFALPADGLYCIGVVTTATIAASAHVHACAQLQLHNA